MLCPRCEQRKARRDCPALRTSICPVCCGTQRLVEIDCPDTCPHLSAARAHPPAVVRRQQEADVARLLPSISSLTERQHQLFFLFHSVIARHRPDGLAPLVDSDVADAAASVAATLETAARGVIYDHTPQSTVARKLADEITVLLQQIRQEGASVHDREAAITLRAIEQGARNTGASAAPDEYLLLMGRLLQINAGQLNRRGRTENETPQGSTIILP